MPSSYASAPEAALVQPSMQPADGLPTAPGVGIRVVAGVGVATFGVAVSTGAPEDAVGRIATVGIGVGRGVVMATGET